jgi:hypothetical protein
VAKEILLLVEGGKIYYTQTRIGKNQDVYWKCVHPFTVDFGVLTPLDGESSAYGKKEGGSTHYVTDDTNVDADHTKRGAQAVFKYTVSVYAPDAQHPNGNRILVEDPEIIIDP